MPRSVLFPRTLVTAFIVALFSIACARAFSPDDIQSYTLENGMRIFVLSDTTAAPVRAELCIDAGYSAQTEKTAGFFPLYARLLGADIAADTVRMVKTVAPQESENALMELAACLKPLVVHDATLRAALAQMKNEVTDYAASTAGFINTAIDARMFAKAPWTVESGVYPALFGATTVSSARAHLNDIAAQYYTPQNARLYISGNITTAVARSLAEKYFGSLKNTATAKPAAVTVPDTPQPRKFVLVDESFSADITQIIMQYNHLSMDEADLAAAALNNDGSTYKQKLAGTPSLAIMGAEYINVASAQRAGSSRLIIQSLLGRTKTSPCAQAEQFVRITTAEGMLSAPELTDAIDRMGAELRRISDNSAGLMELLSGWATLVPHNSVAALFERQKTLQNQLSAPLLEAFLHTQQPFVFVLVDAKAYAAHAKEFQNAGYTAVTRKNGSWYAQQLYQALLVQKAESQKNTAAQEKNDNADAAKRFVAENKAHISSYTLPNGIPITVKQTPSARTTAFALTIRGGELLFAKDSPGLCSVLTDAIAVHIRRYVDIRAANGLLHGDTTVGAKTSASCSVITVTCSASEAQTCARAIAEALVYGDITPALADGITYDERTRWRITSGAATFQLLCSAMRTLYDKQPYATLFDDSKDKPATTEFTRIAAAYPLLLDSSRFSLVVAGGITDGDALKATLVQTFGTLGSQKETASIDAVVQKPTMPRRVKRIQLRHLFLTDISADKAGPRPAVLVPTKNFSDPALYCIPSPDRATTDSALFAALLYEIAERMQEKLGPDITIRTDIADDDFPFARFYTQHVPQISRIDAAYQETLSELTDDLQTLIRAKTQGIIDTHKDRLLAGLENRWLMHTLSATGTALGTAELLQMGASYGNPALYLDQYAAIDAATAEDYFIIMQFYFSGLPDFRVYSIDSKR